MQSVDNKATGWTEETEEKEESVQYVQYVRHTQRVDDSDHSEEQHYKWAGSRGKNIQGHQENLSFNPYISDQEKSVKQIVKEINENTTVVLTVVSSPFLRCLQTAIKTMHLDGGRWIKTKIIYVDFALSEHASQFIFYKHPDGLNVREVWEQSLDFLQNDLTLPLTGIEFRLLPDRPQVIELEETYFSGGFESYNKRMSDAMSKIAHNKHLANALVVSHSHGLMWNIDKPLNYEDDRLINLVKCKNPENK